jgi:hypothetical protein
MTKAEARKMDRLILENVRLKDRLNKNMGVYSEQISEIVAYKLAIEEIEGVLSLLKARLNGHDG